MTLEKYLTIIQRKAMDKEVAKHIKKTRRKEKQNKQVRKVVTTMIAMEWVA